MIRMIQEQDIAACLSIYNWYIENTVITFEIQPLSLEEFTERMQRIRKRYPWIVLEEEGHILGYAYLDTFNAREAYDYTCDVSIYLDHAVKGKGYGSVLMKALLNLARDDGYHEAVSIVTEGNHASEHIHTKFGFENCGFLSNTGYKFQKWLGVTYFKKTLGSGNPVPLQNKDIA